jgi:hypothetical protein
VSSRKTVTEKARSSPFSATAIVSTAPCFATATLSLGSRIACNVIIYFESCGIAVFWLHFLPSSLCARAFCILRCLEGIWVWMNTTRMMRKGKKVHFRNEILVCVPIRFPHRELSKPCELFLHRRPARRYLSRPPVIFTSHKKCKKIALTIKWHDICHMDGKLLDVCAPWKGISSEKPPRIELFYANGSRASLDLKADRLAFAIIINFNAESLRFPNSWKPRRRERERENESTRRWQEVMRRDFSCHMSLQILERFRSVYRCFVRFSASRFVWTGKPVVRPQGGGKLSVWENTLSKYCFGAVIYI